MPRPLWPGAAEPARVLYKITGFYGLPYWYTRQVTILGLGPIWQSDNAAALVGASAGNDEGRPCERPPGSRSAGVRGF
jgi:acyl-CoA dehydrogenase